MMRLAESLGLKGVESGGPSRVEFRLGLVETHSESNVLLVTCNTYHSTDRSSIGSICTNNATVFLSTKAQIDIHESVAFGI